MIDIKGLVKSFNEFNAVDNVTLSIEKGEIFGIVGPDGSGKSTLLRILAGIREPTAGNVLINGIDLFKHLYDFKDNMAYMPQKFGLYEDLSVEENIFFFGKLFGLSNKKIRDKIEMLYSFSHLEPFRERRAGKLSGGMKQKLGLACCLVHDPDIILLDEPTNGVDPVSRREFWKILYDLLRGGKTVVISTAYMDEAERCNRIALMRRGQVIALGNPKEIKDMVMLKFIEFTASDSRKAERILKDCEEFKNIIMTGATLKLFVRETGPAVKRIEEILAKEGVKINSIRENLPGLEDCFVEILALRTMQ